MDESSETTETGEHLQHLLRERGWLHNLARQLVSSRECADDAVNDALAAAWLQVARGNRPRGAVRGLLAAILKNQVAGRRREHLRRQAREHAASRPDLDLPAIDVVVRFEVQREVASAVLALPEPYRTAVLLRFYDRLSPGAIARQLGLPVETVRTRLKRALVQLRERLDAQHGGDRCAWMVPLCCATRWGAASAKPLLLGALLMTTFQKAVCAVTALGAALWLAVASPWSSPPGAAPSAREAAHVVDTALGDVAARQVPISDAGVAPSLEPLSRSEFAGVASVARFEVLGIVVDDETGAPIAHAAVRLGGSVADELADEFGGAFADDLVTTTAEDGSFQIVDDRGSSLPPDADVVRELVVTATDHAGERRQLAVAPAGSPGPVRDLGLLRLVRGTLLAGRVVDREGRGVEGARLLLPIECTYWGNPQAEGMLHRTAQVGRSDADGAFRLAAPVAPSLHHGNLLFAHAPHGIGWCRIEPSAMRRKVEDLVIELRPAGGVRVLVRDEHGRSVADARVRAVPHFAPIGSVRRDVRQMFATDPALAALVSRTTDANGFAEFADLPIGEPHDLPPAAQTGRDWSLYIEAHGYPTQPLTAFEVSPDTRRDMVIDLVPERRLEVAVAVVDDLGRVVPEATVDVQADAASVEARTDADGRATLQIGAATQLTIGAQRAGYRRQQHTVDVERNATRLMLELVIARTQSLDVRVVDQFGAAAAGMSLFVDDRHLGSTDVDGRCHIEHFPAGQRKLLVVLGPDANRAQWTGEQSPEHVDAASGPVTITMQRRPGQIDVQVAIVDASNGKPLEPSASVLTMFFDEQARFLPVTWPAADRGVVRATDLPSGRYRLDVRTATGRRGSIAFELLPAQPPADLRLALPTPGTITGRLRFVDVAPPANVTLRVRHQRRDPHTFVQFRYPGRWHVDGPGQEVAAPPHSGTGDLRLQPASALTFRLDDADPDEALEFSVHGDGVTGKATFAVAPGATFDGTIDVVVRC